MHCVQCTLERKCTANHVIIFANALELHISCTNPLTWFPLSICLFIFFCPTPFSYKLLFWLTQLIHSLCIKWILIISWMLYKHCYLQFILSSSTQLQDRVKKSLVGTLTNVPWQLLAWLWWKTLFQGCCKKDIRAPVIMPQVNSDIMTWMYNYSMVFCGIYSLIHALTSMVN